MPIVPLPTLCTVLLLLGAAARAVRAAEYPPPREVDVRRAAAAGLRLLEGRRLRLFTDLPSSPAVDELPAVFDAAVPQWAAYFGVPDAAPRRFLGFLVGDRQRLASLELLPADNPGFINGYAKGYELWLADQPSDYYRRHLLLHEGTHAFMQTQLGGCGDPWYMEGMAELLGTHTWRDGRLQLGVFPANRDDFPMWGRVKLIREALAAKHAWRLERVLAVDNSRALSTDQYAWTWALAALLDGRPQYRQRFRQLKQYAADPAFSDRFRQLFADDWDDLALDWQAYIAELDYGADLRRTAIMHRQPAPLGPSRESASIAADRGWQATPWLLQAGKSYRLAASGRYAIAHDGEPWPCEPGGVTIQYHNGRPLGVLLGALRAIDGRSAAFATPTTIGLGATITPQQDSVLYVRVNDSAAKLGDNSGELTVTIEPARGESVPGR
ncbi:MAG: hypothetical protein DCC67_11275 [Planctomycetota bacterium]|nr:MAG: hypothetical protein DCC67_11275 [Planctomycetota bacterium]